MDVRQEPLYYWDYLRLDQLLDAQHPVSGGEGEPAHDELLFIVVHQAFELWFKQILHEVDRMLAVMSGPEVADTEISKVVAALGRVTAIQRLLVEQLAVLETMTPLDFLDFRNQLIPASGFQSVQFRLIENRLGLDPRHRLKIKGSPYTSVLHPGHVRLLEESERATSLYDQVERWLARTPFLHLGGFDFWRAYGEAVERMLDADREVIVGHPSLDAEAREAQVAQLEQTAAGFAALLDEDRFAQLRARGHRRMSREALLAALLISLYRDEPVFQLPFRLLTGLIDVDEGFAAWRYRHALLAHRMIGGKIGTGGTAGHEYLEAAARRHRIFSDLFDLPTFFLPRSALPALPAEVEEQMGFRYRGSAA
jgi:tryptophan 2,3-dioxygenase